MMNEMMEYKGYFGSAKLSVEDDIFYGKIEYIRDLIDYQGSDVKELKKAFQESVDDYLETCKKLNKEPDKPFKGSFNVRIGEALHRDAYFVARNKSISLNDVVCKAITEYVANEMGHTSFDVIMGGAVDCYRNRLTPEWVDAVKAKTPETFEVTTVVEGV